MERSLGTGVGTKIHTFSGLVTGAGVFRAPFLAWQFLASSARSARRVTAALRIQVLSLQSLSSTGLLASVEKSLLFAGFGESASSLEVCVLRFSLVAGKFGFHL